MVTDQILEFLITNYIMLTIVVVLLIYRKKLLWDPLCGGNGHVQMDELAKAVILIIFVVAAYKQGDHGYSDAFFAILIAGVFAIAAIKPTTEVLKQRFNNEKDESENP